MSTNGADHNGAVAALVRARGPSVVDEHATDSLLIVPAGGTLEYVGAGVEPPDDR